MRKLRVGAVGAGAQLDEDHGPVLSGGEGFEFRAIADLNLALAKRRARQFGVPRSYRSLSEMIDAEDLDAVVVAIPNRAHADVVVQAHKAGLDVLCEKPLAASLADARRMVKTARTTGRYLRVCLHYELMTRQARASVGGGALLGSRRYSRGRFLRPDGSPGWGVYINRDAQGGGALIDLGPHPLSVALPLIDDEPTHVTARMHNERGRAKHGDEGFEVEDLASVTVDFANGGRHVLVTDWETSQADQAVAGVVVDGVTGGIDIALPVDQEQGPGDIPAPKVIGRELRQLVGRERLDPLPTIRSCLKAQWEEFREISLSGRPDPTSMELGLMIQRILEAAYRSQARGGARVRVPR